MTLLDFNGVSAIISLAAAITIQKIADSRMAIWLPNSLYIVSNYDATLTTLVTINLLKKSLVVVPRI